MKNDITRLREEALSDLQSATDLAGLERVRVQVMGRTGSLAKVGEMMREVPKEERPEMGKLLNEARNSFTAAFEARKSALEEAQDSAAFTNLDVSLPGTAPARGSVHPLSDLQQRVIGILRRMGFSLATGPEVEDEWHCFDALNTPPNHPARNDSDTFYFPDGMLLRTHTSTVQIRTMETQRPPLRIMAPDLVYRRDEIDSTHSFQFTQVEGLYINERVTVGELKGTLEMLVQELLGPETKARFRPSFFPFTEPSFEVDVELRVPGHAPRWVEMGGCGMVDPAVLTSICEKRGDDAYDPERVSGFAFGMGIDRLAMALYQVPDIRYFAENDLRFLRQFA